MYALPKAIDKASYHGLTYLSGRQKNSLTTVNEVIVNELYFVLGLLLPLVICVNSNLLGSEIDTTSEGKNACIHFFENSHCLGKVK